MPGIGGILAGVGGLLQAGGSIAGMFGGGKDNYHPEVWRNNAFKDYLQQIRGVKEAAAKYGFHPLALLGVPPSSGQVVSGGGGGPYIGDALSGAAQGFSDIAGAYQSDQDRMAYEEERQYRRDVDERERMDRIAADIIAADEREKRQRVTDAEVRRLDSETLLNSARTRTELQQLRAGGLGATVGGMSQPSSVALPYTGTWRLAPGTSSASDVQNTMGEAFEWLSSLEQGIWNLLHDPDGSIVVGPPAPGAVPKHINMGIPAY